jgi:hypothetical protein
LVINPGKWGHSLLEEKNYEKAKGAITLLIEKDTTFWDAYYNRARGDWEASKTIGL